MALTLASTEKATVAVALDTDGTVAPFGQTGWDCHLSAPIAHFVNDPDGETTYIVADSAGTANAHFFDNAGLAAPLDIAITVTEEGGGGGDEGTPVLVVTFGSPVPQ